MGTLEERIKKLRTKYKKIWYFADGVYSTYGDTIPVHEMSRLLDEYGQFYLFVDDSHGMSWTGENGRGYVLQHLYYHPKMMVSVSLCKGFGVEGGVIACYDEEMKNKLSEATAPLIAASPANHSVLGSIVESAKIHLSGEIYTKQSALHDRVNVFRNTALEFGIPVINTLDIPIAYIPAGTPEMCREMCFGLMEKGYYVTPYHYPMVPYHNAGLRILISLYQSKDDIRNMLKKLKVEYDRALKSRNMTVNDVLGLYGTEQMEAVLHEQNNPNPLKRGNNMLL
jgi:7-keto-8-aminopelargonate synthetase-like enzyme